MKRQTTYSPRPEDIQRDWWVVDAADLPLGRLASTIANIVRGKHKPTYSPHVDGGDFVIVINAEKVATTGKKEDQKIYYRHSGYPGGLRARTLGEMREIYPERIVEIAVRGMLPKNRLGRKLFTKVKVYAGAEHPHAPQQPKPLDHNIRKVAG